MIRTAAFLGVLALAGCASGGCMAAQPKSGVSATAERAADAATIRDLEERERRAVLGRDIVAIEAFWDPQFLVNGPNNQLLIGRDATLDLIKAGIIDFHRFDRVVERVELDRDVAVAMGSETVVQKRGPQAGQVIQRRYTNVWRRNHGTWQLRFRHANVVPTQPQILDHPRR